MLANLYRPVLLCVFVIGFSVVAVPAPAQLPGFSSGSKDSPAKADEKPADGDSSMLESPFFKVGWPKLQMPKFDWKPGFGGDKPAAKSGGGENPVSRTLDKVADGSKRAANRVRSAWGSAIQQLSFNSPETKTAARSDERGFWSRLFTSEEEPQGAQTVSGFMAQERVGTTRR